MPGSGCISVVVIKNRPFRRSSSMRRIVSVVMASSLWVFPVALGVSCGDDGEDHGDNGDHGDHGGDHGDDHSKPAGPDSGADCPDNSTLTYKNFGEKFMSTYCLRCHSDKVTGAARNGAP